MLAWVRAERPLPCSVVLCRRTRGHPLSVSLSLSLVCLCLAVLLFQRESGWLDVLFTNTAKVGGFAEGDRLISCGREINFMFTCGSPWKKVSIYTPALHLISGCPVFIQPPEPPLPVWGRARPHALVCRDSMRVSPGLGAVAIEGSLCS